jgi:hypothetical protein
MLTQSFTLNTETALEFIKFARTLKITCECNGRQDGAGRSMVSVYDCSQLDLRAAYDLFIEDVPRTH